MEGLEGLPDEEEVEKIKQRLQFEVDRFQRWTEIHLWAKGFTNITREEIADRMEQWGADFLSYKEWSPDENFSEGCDVIHRMMMELRYWLLDEEVVDRDSDFLSEEITISFIKLRRHIEMITINF